MDSRLGDKMKVEELKKILLKKKERRDQLNGLLEGETKRLKEKGCLNEDQAEQKMGDLKKEIGRAMDEIQEGIDSIVRAYDLD